MKNIVWLLSFFIIHTNAFSRINDDFARTHELTRLPSQANPADKNSNGSQSTVTTNNNPINTLFGIVKGTLAVLGVIEVVKQTGSSTEPSSPKNDPWYADQQLSDDDLYAGLSYKEQQDQKIFNMEVPHYTYTTERDSSSKTIKYNSTVEKHKEGLRRHFGIPYPPGPAVNSLLACIAGEAIIDDTYIHLPTMRSVIENYLNRRGADEEIIRAFFQSETGLITQFAVSEFGQKIKVPYAIYDKQNKELLTKLHDIAYHLEYCDGTYIVEACRAIEYLKGALTDSSASYRHACTLLFDAYHRLVTGHGCTALVALADLTQLPFKDFKKDLQHAVIERVAQFCEATTDMRLLNQEDRALVNREAQGFFNNVNNLIAQLRTIDFTLTFNKKQRLKNAYQKGVQEYADRALEQIKQLYNQPGPTVEPADSPETQKTQDPITPARDPPAEPDSLEQETMESADSQQEQCTSTLNYIQKRTGQYNAARQEARTMYDNGTWKAPSLSSAAQNFLDQHNCSSDSFITHLNTPEQQLMQHEFISIVNSAANLDSLNHNQLTRLLGPTIAQLAEVGADYTVLNNLNKATTLADCCWAALDCVVAAGEGAVEGGLNTVQSICNFVRHPLDTTISTAESIAHLGYQLGAVLYQVGDITLSCIVDPDQGEQKWTDFSHKVRTLHDALEHKIRTTPTRELIKDASATLTEAFLTGKCTKAVVPLIGKALENAEKVVEGIKHTLDAQSNFQIGDGVVAIAVGAADTVAASAEQSLALERAFERAGQLYVLSNQGDSETSSDRTNPINNKSATYESIDDLIKAAGKLERKKKKVRQGFIKGNAKEIFNNLAKNYDANVQNNGQHPFFEKGDLRIGIHNSTKGNGIPTLDINMNGKIYKIRVLS